jgi:hypothetical protein
MSNKTTKKKLCFVVGPIGIEDSEIRVHADWLLEEIIQPVLSEFSDYEVKRADQGPRLTSDLVIADLSGVKSTQLGSRSSEVVGARRRPASGAPADPP